jgi:hypothetical protein
LTRLAPPQTSCADPDHDGSDPIPDVSEVLVSVLERENTFKKVIKMRSGDTPINSALENI